MLRKFVTILTILAISLSAILPVQLFAAADIGHEARICRDLGILKGDTGVVDSEYLKTRPTRLQAAIMFLRLKGLEEKALAYTGGNNFKDASSIAWREGRNVLSYLKDHPELGWIGDGVNFLPYNLIDAKAYYKVLLESLGYKQKIDGEGDFDWNSVLDFAESKGLKKVADERYFTVESLAIATVEALDTKMKSTGKKLIDYLVEIGAVDSRAARDLDMYTEDVDAEVKHVRAISNSKVEVVFMEPVGSRAADEDLYSIKQLDVLRAAMKNDSAVIIDTSAMKENNTYTLVLDGRSYSFKGLKKDSYGPKLISVECKDTNLVELTFDRILDNVTAQNPDIYTIEDARVKSAELDSTNTKVRLTTSGVEAGRSYELKIKGIKNGDGVTTKSITKRFSGRKDTTAPKLNKLTVLNNIRLLLEFSDSNGLDKGTAQDIDNYRITSNSGELEVEDVIVKDTDEDGLWETVELVTEQQDSGKQYTLIIDKMTDASVSKNSTTREIKRDFRGKGADKSGPTVARNPVAVTNTMVEIEFSDSNALDIESACDTSNYEIDGLDIIDARIKNPSNLYSSEGRTVYLITEEMEKAESYTLTIYGIQDEFGNEMKSSSGKKYRFKGLGEDRTPPYVTFVECIDSRTIQLTFDNQLDEKSAENIINYRIDGLALVTKAVLQKDGKTVRLTVSSLSSDRNHTVSLNNIEDLSGNALSNVNVSLTYKSNQYDDDPPEVSYIEAVNRDEVWIHFEEEVYAENAEMKASGITFHQRGSVLDGRTTVVMKASSPMSEKEYEVTKLEGIRDLRNNRYVLEDNLDFYGTDIENDPPEVDDWDQEDIRRFRVVFSEPVLLKDNWTSGISGSDIAWKAVLNPEGETDTEAYSTVDFIATNRNIPADREFKFNFTKIVTDYAGKDAWDDEDYNYGPSGSTILESYMEDDEEPYIEYVEALTRNKAQIVFNEAMREPGRYNISYYDDKGKLRSINIELTEIDAKDNTKVNLYTREEMDDEYYYILKPVSAALDIAGNKLDIKNLEIEFEGSNIMGSEFIQDVDILNKDTLWVTKSSSISNVSSLYKLGSDGGATGGNLIERTSRVSDNMYEVISKEPLYKNVRYEITVDGLRYKFYGEYEGKSYQSSAKDILSYTLKGKDFEAKGSIDEKNGIIRVTVPYGTDPEKATPVINCSEGASVVVKWKSQPEEAQKNNLLKIIIYTIVAEDGSKKDYEIRIGEESSAYEKKITSFIFKDFDPDVVGDIDERQHVITLTVPAGTVLTELRPTIETSPGTRVYPESGEKISFKDPGLYKVVAKDGSTQEYTVVVKVAKEMDKSIRSFEFKDLRRGGVGVIDEEKGRIDVTVPYDTDLTSMIPTIVIPENTRISPKSGEAQDFRRPVEYTVTAKDRTTKQYTVYVTKALSSGNRITYFALPGYGPDAEADVQEDQRLIELKVPFGTDRSKLAATFNASPEAVVKVGDKVQRSGVTENDFTKDVKYTVTAQDGTVREYKVRVTTAQSSEKQLKQFGFLSPAVTGIIDEAAKQISVKVPNGTALGELKAVFVSSDRSKVYVGDTEQKSGETVQDFTKPVIYTVVAQDGSRQDYTLTVTDEAASVQLITSFAFNGLTPPAAGVIDHANRTIRVTVPRGTVLRNLVATFEFQGKGVEAKRLRDREWVPQVSGVTANNFSQPVQYRVIPNEGSPVIYTVTVSEETRRNDDWFRIRR